MPEYSPRDRHSPPAVDYLNALNELIASQGERCPAPLSQDTGIRLFPLVAVRYRERQDKRISMRQEKKQNQADREREQKRRRYKHRMAQAALELAFHTPVTVSKWYARWQDKDIFESDMSALVIDWLARFPSCRHVEPLEWYGEPLWRVMIDIRILAGEQRADCIRINQLMLPNRLERAM